MPDRRRTVRVLQLIGSTDADPAQLAAVALHRSLVSLGLEVRTLALAPGRTGGLEQDVPAMAPSRRSFAARGMVAGESRWADVVVLHAPRALTTATAPSRRGPTVPLVVAHWQAPARGSSGAATRIHAAAHAVVAPDQQVADALRVQVPDVAQTLVAPAELSDPGRPALDGVGWARIVTDAARAGEAS